MDKSVIRNVAIKQKLPSGRLSVSPAVGRVWQGVKDGLISGLASPSSGSEEEDVLGLVLTCKHPPGLHPRPASLGRP